MNAPPPREAVERFADRPSTYADPSWLERVLGTRRLAFESRWALGYLDTALLVAARAAPFPAEPTAHGALRLAMLPGPHHHALALALGSSALPDEPIDLGHDALAAQALMAVRAGGPRVPRAMIAADDPADRRRAAIRIGEAWLVHLANAQPAAIGRRWRLRLPRPSRGATRAVATHVPIEDGEALAARLVEALEDASSWRAVPCW